MTRETDLRQPRDFDYGERLEKDYLADDRRLAQMDRIDRHTGAIILQRRGPDGYRAFPAPPSGFRLVWEHDAEPRLERV